MPAASGTQRKGLSGVSRGIAGDAYSARCIMEHIRLLSRGRPVSLALPRALKHCEARRGGSFEIPFPRSNEALASPRQEPLSLR